MIEVFKLPGSIFIRGSSTNMTRMVRFLNQKEIALSMEFGPLIPPEDQHCANNGTYNVEGFAGPSAATYISMLVTSWGGIRKPSSTASLTFILIGAINYLAMDEPLFYGHCYNGVLACYFPISDIVSQINQTVRAFQAIFPNIVVGGIAKNLLTQK